MFICTLVKNEHKLNRDTCVCIVFALYLHCICIVFALCLHCVRIVFALCSHCICIVFALCLHCICMVFAYRGGVAQFISIDCVCIVFALYLQACVSCRTGVAPGRTICCSSFPMHHACRLKRTKPSLQVWVSPRSTTASRSMFLSRFLQWSNSPHRSGAGRTSQGKCINQCTPRCHIWGAVYQCTPRCHIWGTVYQCASRCHIWWAVYQCTPRCHIWETLHDFNLFFI